MEELLIVLLGVIAMTLSSCAAAPEFKGTQTIIFTDAEAGVFVVYNDDKNKTL